MRKARQVVLELGGREVVITNPDKPFAAGDMLRISYGGGHLLWRTRGLARADEVIE